MLSGIRTGKKKKRKATEEAGEQRGDAASRPDSKRPAAAVESTSDNLSVAEQIRLQLASGKPLASSKSMTTTKSAAAALPFERLQKEGRIEQDHAASSAQNNTIEDVVVLTGSAGNPDRPDYRPEDFRYGSRKGKVKRSYADASGTLKEHVEMNIQDMVEEELKINQQSIDEVYARNVARVGSRYKGTDYKQSSATGADEEDAVDMTMFRQQHLTTHAQQQKERSRQLAKHDKEVSISCRCWWWMDSPSFRKHMLIALGNHVSLVMAPAHLSLQPGEQLYLVPVAHADALVSCEDDVWNEIQSFQQSLRKMYAKEGKGVVFTETVLPMSKGFWQTRLECIAVPTTRDAENAEMFFKTALTEQAEEWGTHNKLMPTRDKGLRRTVPKQFPYFYVEWDTNRGYAQIIESSSFPKDLAQDTLAGMLDIEPTRFRRKEKQSMDQEKRMVLDFVNKWKPFDWTISLD